MSPELKQRLAATLALLAALVLAASGLADRTIGLAGPHSLAATSSATLDRNFKEAAAVFATARALNAAISVAKSVQLSAGVGVQGAAQPFQVLDPIDKLIEEFSSLMLGATVALGGTLMLVEIGDRFALAAVLPVGLGLVALALWVPGAVGGATRRAGQILLVVALIAKLGLPATVLLSDAMADAVVAPRIERAGGRLQAIDVPGLPQASVDTPSWLDTLRRMEDISGQVTRAFAAAHTLADDVIDLTVAFLIKIVVVPLVTLWLLTRLAEVMIAGLVPRGAALRD
jgi:hypothetical protein